MALPEDRLSALYEVSQAIGSSLDLAEVLNQVMDAVIRLTKADRGFIMLFNEMGGLDVRAARNVDKETIDGQAMEVSRSVVREVAKIGKGVVTTNAQSDPRFSAQESVVHFSLRSIMSVPLKARGKTIGVLYVDNKARVGMFGEENLTLLESFANQAAVAIENARLYTLTDQALAQRIEELETLQNIDRELNASLDFNHVMSLALDWAKRNTGAEGGWIGLVDVAAKEIRIVAGDEATQTISLDDKLIRAALAATEATAISANTNSPVARLFAPVRRERRPLALIALERSGSDFPPVSVSFMSRFADHAAFAIENARLYEALKIADRKRNEFVSHVSHELRLPMTSIKGYTDLLKSGVTGAVTDQQKQFLQIIRTNVDRMNVLVTDLSDVSKIEVGRLKVDIGAVDVAVVVNECVDSLKLQIEEKKQTIQVNLPSLPPARTDKTRLSQILVNLISNASKYTPQEGMIAITAEVRAPFVRVSVADSGIGMSPDDQQKLFSQFFRSEDAQVREQQGWGLG
ncbi:MAG: GAF domain-containing protein, partial [Chloroflexi bacterium]|nr:GAF domain-containing protein [Chloroflexota bacterium]